MNDTSRVCQLDLIEDVVALVSGGGENKSSLSMSILINNAVDCSILCEVMALHGYVIDVDVCFVLNIFGEVYNQMVRSHVPFGNILDPEWNCGRKHQNLKLIISVLSARGQNFLNFILESKLEHLIGFIKNDAFKIAEVNVSSLHMIKYSSNSSHKNINSMLKLPSLISHRLTATIKRHNSKLTFVVSKLFKNIGDLDSKFTSRSKTEGLQFTSSETFLVSQSFN